MQSTKWTRKVKKLKRWYLKFATLKSRIGIKSQKVYKHIRDQRNGAQSINRKWVAIYPKAFAIPTLIA